jgi:hypothetical protein
MEDGESLALSVERPILLSPESRARLDSARKRLKEDVAKGTTGGGHQEETEEVNDEILERAFEDVDYSIR